jgi:hypothetical protein
LEEERKIMHNFFVLDFSGASLIVRDCRYLADGCCKVGGSTVEREIKIERRNKRKEGEEGGEDEEIFKNSQVYHPQH